MKRKLVYIFVIAVTLILAQCRKKAITVFTKPVEELPLPTQEGKNTCGFLVNGKLWLPKGKVGNGSSNLKWWYDAGYHNGTFNIHGYRYDKSEGEKFTSFVIAIDNFKTPGIYNLNTAGRVSGYSDYNKSCIYYPEDTISNLNNHINITRFDLSQRIVAGTFQFTLVKTGCDTIRITQGRFDIKL